VAPWIIAGVALAAAAPWIRFLAEPGTVFQMFQLLLFMALFGAGLYCFRGGGWYGKR
jgi:hypothetical protein